MPTIEIPDDYWTIRPRGFASSIGRFIEQLPAIAAALTDGAAPVLNGNDAQLRGELASADGDADTMRALAATNRAALDTTPTSDVLVATGTADRLTQRAEISRGESEANPGNFSFAMEAPPVNEAPTPPPPELPAPPPGGADALQAAITALYEELLQREPDGAGMATWVYEVAQNHHTIAWVREQIMASPEYQAKHAGDATPPAEPAPTTSTALVAAAAPIDTTGFVTHAQLAQVLEHFETTITLVV